MNCSPLVSHVHLSPNCVPRTHPIEGITPHHAGGCGTLEALGNIFATGSASANYGISQDGTIACFVPEDYRAYTSSSRENDDRCVTIEVLNSGGEPDWPISDAAYESLVALCADICRRHGFKLNFTGDKTGNLTMHRYFAATPCPGPYLANLFPDLAADVNGRLEDEKAEEKAEVFYRVQVGAFNEKTNAEALAARLEKDGYGKPFVVEVRK